MSIKVLVDMNLSPEWAPLLVGYGWEAVHWSTVGAPHATDSAIMAWARAHGYTVFTHDLDFGVTVALTHATGPSVLQLRGQNVLAENISRLVVAILRRYEAELTAGALVVIDESRSRVRVLPL